MPKRKRISQQQQQCEFEHSKRGKFHSAAQCCDPAEPNSDESHRTEQLLHRDSVTPPQGRPARQRKRRQQNNNRKKAKAASPPQTSQNTQASSQAESDVLQYNPDTALYYPGTDLVIDGWFQPCRGCGAFTAGRLTADDREAPVCQRCQQKLNKAVEGITPYDCDSPCNSNIDYFYGWMNIKVPLKRQQSVADRQLVQHDLIIRMSDHWVTCREEARAQNCSVPCA